MYKVPRLLAISLAVLFLSADIPVRASAAPPVAAHWGDVDNDYRITTTDARLVLQHAVGKTELKDRFLALANVDGNGKVDTADARMILQCAVGKNSNGYPVGRDIYWQQDKDGNWYITIKGETYYR